MAEGYNIDEARAELQSGWNRLGNALVNNDSTEQAALQSKLDKNTQLDSLYRDQLQYLQD